MGKEWDNLGAVQRATRGTQTEWKRPEWESSKAPKFRSNAPAFDLSAGSNRAMQEWHARWFIEVFRVLVPGGTVKAFGGTRTFHRLTTAMEIAGLTEVHLEAWTYSTGFPKSLSVGKAIDKRGGNPNFAQHIGGALRDARIRRGWTQKEADDHFCGGTTNWSWFEGRPAGQRIPSMDDFARIAKEWPELALLAENVAEAERTVIGSRRSGIGNSATGHYTVGGTVNLPCDITAPATLQAAMWEGWGTALKPAWEPVLVGTKPR
jgi:site-specific DNA-methyltransferase (adenine-specific)